MLAFTSLVLFPSLLHDLRDYPDSTIGVLLAARGTGNWVAFLVVVPFSRRYPRLAVATGLFAQAVAAWHMAQFDINVSSFDVFWTNALQGFGFGLAYTPMTVLAFATLPAHQITEASGVFTLVRNFGSSPEHPSVYQTSPELWEREAFEEQLDGAPEATGEPGKSSAGELGRLAVRVFFSAGAGLLAWSHMPVETAQ
jgi:hypothetical protein